MTSSNARILLLAGLTVVLVMVVSLVSSYLIWGWPTFEVKSFSWK